jgi:Flp pilus assembly protein TadG
MNRFTKNNLSKRSSRRGVAILECALVLPVLLFVLFSMLDLGLAAVRYNALAEASRRIAREAILHGATAPTSSGMWGPATFAGTAADSSTIVAPVKNMLPTMIASDVNISVTWPDSDNSPRDPVQVVVTYVHHPIVPAISVWGAITLKSTATMHVVN